LAVVVVLIACGFLGWRIPIAVPSVMGPGDRPSVLLITIDTLRADHLGAYGYDRARTPNLDAMAARGVLFREVVAPAVQTGPSHASILSGLLPEGHGVLLNGVRISESVSTIADALNDAGYVTAAFVGGWTTTDRSSGLPSRFQFFDDDLRRFRLFPAEADQLGLFHLLGTIRGKREGIEEIQRGAEAVVGPAIDWIERNGDKPFFVWVHLFDPHLPYNAPEKFVAVATGLEHSPVTGRWYDLKPMERVVIASTPKHVEQMIALYDAEIAYSDSALGPLLESVRRSAGDVRLLTVVTSDHGESMGEHEQFWTRDLYDPTLMVPLIIVPPGAGGWESREVAEQVRLIDIAPTILELLAINEQIHMDGRSLVRMIRGEGVSSAPALSATYNYLGVPMQDRRAVRHDGWKLIRWLPGYRNSTYHSEISQELFNLREDPHELLDVAESDPETVRRLESELDELLAPGRVPVQLTPEEQERLRSLGYVQ
jgi:arylsulfatase A-like enzyme